jgi:hypothetical protein
MTDPVPDVAPHLPEAALAMLPSLVERSAYERSHTRIGIVHIGGGALHRAYEPSMSTTCSPPTGRRRMRRTCMLATGIRKGSLALAPPAARARFELDR